MKKFIPPEHDDSSLSPWQKENLKFLKKHQEVNQTNKKEVAQETKIDSSDKDVFFKEEKPAETTIIKRYIKPTDMDEMDFTDDFDDFSEWNPDDIKLKGEEESPQDYFEKTKKEADTSESHEEERPTLKLLSKDESDDAIGDEEKALDEFEDEEQENRLQALWNRIKPKSHEAFLTKKVRTQLYVVVTILSIALLITLYYMTPLSSLEKINVVGNATVSTQEVIQKSQFKTGQRLWHQYFARDKAVARIDRLPGVKSVSISLNHWNQLTIRLTEYPVVGYASVDKIKYSPILSDGTIVTSQVANKKPDGILYTGFKQGSFLSSVIKAYQKVPENVRKLVTQITATPTKSNPQLVTLYMKDGNQVKIDGTQMSKLKYYPQVASQMSNTGVIDMEVGIYSYPYGNDDMARKMKNKKNVADGTVVNTNPSSSTSSSTREIVIPDN